MNKKLVIFDVDGTIISEDRRVPDSAIRAIRKIRENGNYAIYYTGRPYSHVEKNVSDIGFDGCVCTMGAYVRIGDQVLKNQLSDTKTAHEIVRLVRSCYLDAAYESNAGIQFDHTTELPPFLRKLKEHFSGRGFETDQDIDAEDFSFEKVCVWTNVNSDLAAFEKEATNYLDIIGKKQNMEELVAKGVSIPESLKLIQNYFHVTKEDCYAIGDSVNDLPMLRCAACSIAMGQAPEELKKQVDFVTKPIMEDGLAYAMQQYELI